MRRFSFLLITYFISQIGTAFAGWEADRDSAYACFDAVRADPQYKIIVAKLVRANPTLDQLADETVPTDSEAGAIRSRAQRDLACRQMELAAVRKYHPFLTTAYEIRHFQIDLVHVQLIQRRISYGNANRLLQESHLEYRGREERYVQARNDAERRAIADVFARDATRTRSESRIPQGASRITCRWIGSTLYCDAY